MECGDRAEGNGEGILCGCVASEYKVVSVVQADWDVIPSLERRLLDQMAQMGLHCNRHVLKYQ